MQLILNNLERSLPTPKTFRYSGYILSDRNKSTISYHGRDKKIPVDLMIDLESL